MHLWLCPNLCALGSGEKLGRELGILAVSSLGFSKFCLCFHGTLGGITWGGGYLAREKFCTLQNLHRVSQDTKSMLGKQPALKLAFKVHVSILQTRSGHLHVSNEKNRQKYLFFTLLPRETGRQIINPIKKQKHSRHETVMARQREARLGPVWD